MALTGAITGAGAQAVTTPVLVLSYWVLGLPLGSVWAFLQPALGLLGVWLGMILAVYLHMLTYLGICFGRPCLPFGINWEAAAQDAQERVGSGQQAAPQPVGCTNSEPVVPSVVPLPQLVDE